MAYGIPGASPSMVAQQQRITALPSDPEETALAKYLIQLAQQNKVGTPEYYMAAGEFEKRDAMRKEKAAKQQQGPNVVQNITAKAVEKLAPQMAMAAPISRGVGALDPGGMGRIESPVYTGAMGGIVAFEEGGQANSGATADQIEQLYSRELARKSDPEGYRFWSEKFGPEVSADERALFIAEAAPEVQRRLAAGDTGLPDYMKVDPNVRRALQSKDITTDEYKTLANYFGNQWIGGEAEDPASLTRRDYIERPRTGYDLATFLSTRSQQHGAAPDTQQRMTNLLAPYIGPTGETRAVSDEGTGVYVTNPMTGETELANPLGVDNMYRTYRPPHHGSIGDTGNRYAVGMDYKIDPETGKAYYVGPYTSSYTDRGHRDWQGPLGILSLAAGAYFGGPEGLLRSIATSAVTGKAAGGEVKRYQGQGPSFVQSSTSPFMRDVQAFSEAGRQSMMERTPGMMGRFNRPLISPEEEERMRLIQMLNQKFGPQGSLIQGYFMNQSPEQREQAKDIVRRIPTMSLTELRNLAGVAGPASAITPEVTGQRFMGSDKAGEVGDIRKADIAAGGQYSPSMPSQVAPYIPKSMQMGDLAPSIPSLDTVFARASQIVNKSFGAAPKELTIKQGVGVVDEALKEAGFDPKFHQQQIAELRREKEGIKGERQEATNLRLIEMGLGILGGESPYFGVNVGKGASPALKGLAEDFKDIKKIDRERDKAIRDLQTAEQDVNKAKGLAGLAEVQKSRERVDRVNELRAGKEISVFNTLAQITSQEKIAGMPGAAERITARALKDPTFAAQYEKLFGRRTADPMSDAVEYYMKNPNELQRLKMSPNKEDVALYSLIQSKIAQMSVMTNPAGRTVRE